LEPALANDLVACRLRIGFPVAPAAATEAFAALAMRRGVEIVLSDGWAAWPAVVDWRVVGIERAGSIEPAGAVVVAAGPLTSTVVDRSGSWRPILPSWGVVASIVVAGAPRHALEAIDIEIEPSEADEPVRSELVDDGAVEFSLVPALGSSALGSTFLSGQPEPDAWLSSLRRVGSRYVPAVADAR
jgi:glycine/D-amino acid oxidase-like deaminating enzyme